MRPAFRVLTTFALLALPRLGLAQYGSISGTVTNQVTNLPVEGVMVSVAGTSYGVMTKANGTYTILGVPPGSYTIVAKHIGYEPETAENVAVRAGVTRQLDCKLTAASNSPTVHFTPTTPAAQRNLIVEQGTIAPRAVDIDTRFFPLQYLTNTDAAKLVAPFVQMPSSGVYEAGSAVRGITVKATRPVLAEIDSTLRLVDRPPVDVVLRFQLIAAVDGPGRDPAIPLDVDATLHDLFKFGSYKLISQGTATSSQMHFSLTLADGENYFMLDGGTSGLGSRGRGGASGNSSRSNSASLLDGSGVQLDVSLRGKTTDHGPNGAYSTSWNTLLSTGLSVPVGQTVVLGSGAAFGDRRAVILTVLPELLKPGR